jgi:hypothetical protein
MRGGMTMRALVVFESSFGNTRRVAEAIADGLSSKILVETIGVDSVPVESRPDVDLLVVGGPTQAFSMSRPGTRQQAANHAEHGVVSNGIGIREWLASLRAPLRASPSRSTRGSRSRA